MAEYFFGITHGLNMPHINTCGKRKNFPNLATAVTEAMDSGTQKQWQVGDADQNATLKVVPHFSPSNELIGAIVLVSDNTNELKQANAELQLVFDNVPAAISVRDKTGKILSINRKAVTILETSAENAIGSDFYDYFDPETAKLIETDDRIVIDTGQPLLEKTQFVRYRSGKEIWARMSRIPAEHPNADGPVIYAVTQNITEQHIADEALKKSEVRLDQAVKASGVGLWDWDVVNDKVYCSQRLLEMLGLDDDDLSGDLRDINTRIHPDDLDHVNFVRKQHFEKLAPYNLTYRLKQNSNNYIWVETHGQAVWDDENKPIRFTGTLRDITSEKQTADAIREQKEQLELAATLSGIGYWSVGIEDQSLFWSNQVHKIHGTEPKSYQPKLDEAINFYHPYDRKNIQDYIAQTIDNKTSFMFEARIIRTDKKERIVRSIGAPDIDDSGKVVSIFGVFQDIDEDKKRADDLQLTLNELGCVLFPSATFQR